MTHLGPGTLAGHVSEESDAEGEATLDVDLLRADEGDVAQTPPASRRRRVSRVDVGGRGDQDADDVVVGRRVAGVHLVEQRVHPLAHVVDVVLIESGGAAKSANCGGHGGAG